MNRWFHVWASGRTNRSLTPPPTRAFNPFAGLAHAHTLHPHPAEPPCGTQEERLSILDLAFRSRNPNPNRNLLSRIFDHEKLAVHRAALASLDWLEPVLQKPSTSLSLVDQLDRASNFDSAQCRRRQRRVHRSGSVPLLRHRPRLGDKQRCAQEVVAAGKDRL
jgi:hypothetical protein